MINDITLYVYNILKSIFIECHCENCDLQK